MQRLGSRRQRNAFLRRRVHLPSLGLQCQRLCRRQEWFEAVLGNPTLRRLEIRFPFPEASKHIGGVTFDAATSRLYVSKKSRTLKAMTITQSTTCFNAFEFLASPGSNSPIFERPDWRPPQPPFNGTQTFPQPAKWSLALQQLRNFLADQFRPSSQSFGDVNWLTSPIRTIPIVSSLAVPTDSKRSPVFLALGRPPVPA